MRGSATEKPANDFMSARAAAELLGLSPRTIDRWRWTGEGPPYRKHGGRVLYAREDLLAWSAARMKTSTSAR
jgi:DNA-binding transcriptional MerR regulator